MICEDIPARLAQPWLADPAQAKRFAMALDDALDDCLYIEGWLVKDGDRVAYLARVLGALAAGKCSFLGNPHWGGKEFVLANEMMTGGSGLHGGRILIPTGGTGGRLKFAIHSWETLLAAVEGYAAFWNRTTLNAVCPLPVCHIGGLMLALRTFITGGRLWLADPKLETPPPPDFDLSSAHVSLVGAQLRRALDNGVGWLRECEAVLVGGGPTDQRLVDDALQAGIPLYTAYGLTEAAATVAIARADEDPTLGTILPHWQASIGEGGAIHLDGPSLFLGYLGEESPRAAPWPTGDRGELVDGRLRVLGRMGRVIITGGKKVDASLLESRLVEWPEIEEALVFGEADPHWGEAVRAVVVTGADAASLSAWAKDRLLPEMRPKAWGIAKAIPRLENGKPDWPAIRAKF